MAFINGVEVLFSAQVVKEGVVQTKGNSTTDVMSQRAVTTELNALDEKINKIDGGIVVENYSKLIALFEMASADEYKLGQAIYVMQNGVPDLYISDIDPDNFYWGYTYTTDAQFISDLNNASNHYKIGFGHYYVSLIETEKQDLSSCATKSEVNALRDEVNARFVITDKRLANLEAGIPDDDFITDNSTAYVRDVPSNALPFAEVTEIGGVTRKCTQLFDVAKAQVGYRCNNDGSLVKNTSYATSDYIEVRGGTSYYLTNVCGNHYCSAVLFDANKEYVNITSLGAGGKVSGVLNVDSNIKYIRINISTDVVDINTVMVNEGSTPLPYEPYFSGLRSAPVTEVVSEGVQMIPYPYTENSKTYNGVTWTVNADRSITASGTATDYSTFYLANKEKIPNAPFTVAINGIDSTNVALMFRMYDANNTIVFERRIYTWDKVDPTEYPTATYYVMFLVRDNNVAVSGTFKPMLAIGTTAQPYKPYIMPRKITIPESVRPAHGIPNTDCYDRIRWRYDEPIDKWVRESEKRLGVVDMGTLDWIYGIWGSDMVFSTLALTDIKQNTNAVVCTIPFVKATEVYNAIVDNSFTVNGQAIRGRFSNYTDVATFKAALSGVMLVYELATPEVTDISHLLPEDNLIGVEGGGSITMQNEYGYDVPAKVTYQIEEETV